MSDTKHRTPADVVDAHLEADESGLDCPQCDGMVTKLTGNLWCYLCENIFEADEVYERNKRWLPTLR